MWVGGEVFGKSWDRWMCVGEIFGVFFWWLVIVCFYCVGVGDGIGSFIVWWIYFGVWFWIGRWSVVYYVVIGRRGENYGGSDLWNGFCLLCFYLCYFFLLGENRRRGCVGVVIW